VGNLCPDESGVGYGGRKTGMVRVELMWGVKKMGRKNNFAICAVFTILFLMVFTSAVNAEDMHILDNKNLIETTAHITAFPTSISLANGPANITFNATGYTGPAAPPDNYTWTSNDENGNYKVTQNQFASEYNRTFTSAGKYALTLISENRTFEAENPGETTHGLLTYSNNGNPHVLATVPIEGNFTNVSVENQPFVIELNYTFNNTQYRGIPDSYNWTIYRFSDLTGQVDTFTKTKSESKFNYKFPVISDNYTYTVRAWATNTSGFVVDNYSTRTVNVSSTPLICANFTVSPIGCQAFPVSVSFKDNSTGYLSVDSQLWDFNDSIIVRQNNPTHVYQKPGSYTVNYTAINTTYNFQNSSQMVVPVAGLYSNFTYDMNPASGRFNPGDGIRVNFTNISDGNPTNYLWNFGDNSVPDSPLTNSYANHTYTKQGKYNATLTVFKTCGDTQVSNTSVRTISVFENLNSSFSYQPKSGKYPLPVQFTDTSSDSPNQWEWWLYDADGVHYHYFNTSTASLVYNAPGSYRVVLHTVNNIGQTATNDTTIQLYSGISADFTTDKTSGIYPLTVNFTDASIPAGQASKWTWAFGDGKSGGTTQNISHTFDKKGNWTVSLTASDSETSNTTTKFISVGSMITPNFTPHGLLPTRAPYIINFTDQSTPSDEVSGWQWSFSDGGQANGRTVSHQFSGPGNYTVQMNVSSFWDTRNVTYAVNITEVKAPVADFAMSPTLLNAGESVTFIDHSSGPGQLNWSWEFGDGETSANQSPVHVYQYAGKYYPKVTVTNPYGNDTKTSPVPVMVRGPVIPSFITDKPDWWSVINQPVTFIDTSKGQPDTWVWDFADGTSPMTVTEPQVTHTYTKKGIYNVTMTATTWNGDTSTAFHSFEVTDKDVPRDVSFGAAGKRYSGNHPFTVQFEDYTPNQSNVTEWYWDFGDRSNSFNTTPVAPSHTYVNPGEYTVTLSVKNDMGVNEKTRVAYVVVV